VGHIAGRQRVSDDWLQVVTIQSRAGKLSPAIMAILAAMNLPHAIRFNPGRPPFWPYTGIKFPLCLHRSLQKMVDDTIADSQNDI
jgi:hypothetical protein